MTSSSPLAIVTVMIERRDGYIFAHSDDVPGLDLCSQNEESIAKNILAGIKLLFKLNRGLNVEVMPVTDLATFPTPAPLLAGNEAAKRFAMVAQ